MDPPDFISVWNLWICTVNVKILKKLINISSNSQYLPHWRVNPHYCVTDEQTLKSVDQWQWWWVVVPTLQSLLRFVNQILFQKTKILIFWMSTWFTSYISQVSWSVTMEVSGCADSPVSPEWYDLLQSCLFTRRQWKEIVALVSPPKWRFPTKIHLKLRWDSWESGWIQIITERWLIKHLLPKYLKDLRLMEKRKFHTGSNRG